MSSSSNEGGKWDLPKMEWGLESPKREDQEAAFSPTFWPPSSGAPGVGGGGLSKQIQLLLPDQRRELFYLKTKKVVNPDEKLAREQKRCEFLSMREGKQSNNGQNTTYDAKQTLLRIGAESKFSANVEMEATLLKPYRESASAYSELMNRFNKSEYNKDKKKGRVVDSSTDQATGRQQNDDPNVLPSGENDEDHQS